MQDANYIDEIKYKGNTRCDGIVVYDYNDEEIQFSNGRAYLARENDLYFTSGASNYLAQIKKCIGIDVPSETKPDTNPNSTTNPEQITNPKSNENNNIYKIVVVHDVIGVGDEEIYLKYGIGWYSDANGANAINKINTKVKTGYTLKGYYTEQNGNGDQIIDENGNINSGTITLVSTENPISVIYAYWEPSKFYITYNANGGTGEKMSDTLFEYGVEQSLSKNTYTRKGYTFAGWSQIANGPVTYIDSQVVKFTSLDTSIWNLYAIWTPNKYKISLNKNGSPSE